MGLGREYVVDTQTYVWSLVRRTQAEALEFTSRATTTASRFGRPIGALIVGSSMMCSAKTEDTAQEIEPEGCQSAICDVCAMNIPTDMIIPQSIMSYNSRIKRIYSPRILLWVLSERREKTRQYESTSQARAETEVRGAIRGQAVGLASNAERAGTTAGDAGKSAIGLLSPPPKRHAHKCRTSEAKCRGPARQPWRR